MTDDVKTFIASCRGCVELKPEVKIKAPQIIESHWPLERLVADCWTICPSMLKAMQDTQSYKYVLTCVDHFSRYKWCWLIRNKEASTILSKLEIAFKMFERPDIFQSDHGKEFDNKLIREYCTKNRIRYIQGSVRHPESQGAVEKINNFISKSLTASLREFKSNPANKNGQWDIENAIEAFRTNQNNKVHSVTKMVPQELVIYRNKTSSVHRGISKEVFNRVQEYYNSKNIRLTKSVVKVGIKVYIVNEVQRKNEITFCKNLQMD